MDNCPFVEELSVKHGDCSCLCEMTRGYIIYELTLLQYIYIYFNIFQYINTFHFMYIYILYGHRPKRFRYFFFWKAMFHSCCPHKDTLRQDRAAPGESMRPGGAQCAVSSGHRTPFQHGADPPEFQGAKGGGEGGFKGIYSYWPLAW